MTYKEAKGLSLEVWRNLEEHPEIDRKYDLPNRLYARIKIRDCRCPLCELLLQEAIHYREEVDNEKQWQCVSDI
jgi:hypothetical protein